MAISFDKPNRVIFIDSPQAEVSIQDLLNAIRDYEDELDNLDIPKVANASGKEDLGSGVLVGITLELLDNWRVQFEARPGPDTESVSVSGGNIVAQNIYNNNPIKPSAYTQVAVTSSSSATIAQLQIIDLVHRIESLRGNFGIGSYGRFGRIIYWNPTSGNDAFLGDKPEKGVKTFAAAHALATADQGDTIFCLTRDASSVVLVDEQLVITKKGLSIRGPGKGFEINSQTGTGASVSIQADDVEVSGLIIRHNGGGFTYGISVTNCDNVSINNVTIIDSNSHGIFTNSVNDVTISNCHIEDSGGSGIYLSANSVDLSIIKNNIHQSISDGVTLSVASVVDTIFEGNNIFGNGNYGINILNSALGSKIKINNFIANNIAGILNDEGINTAFEATEDQKNKFNGIVNLDSNSSNSGLDYPTGTISSPVNNIIDAIGIANVIGVKTIKVTGTITLDDNEDYSGFIFIGDSPDFGSLDLNNALVDKCLFKGLKLIGICNGSITADLCTLDSITSLKGSVTQSSMIGNISLPSSGVNTLFGSNIVFGGYSPVEIDIHGAGNILGLTNLNGDIIIKNMESGIPFPSSVSVGFISGSIELENNNTGGSIKILGFCKVINNSAGSSVDILEVINKDLIADKIWDEAVADHVSNGSFGDFIKNKILTLSKFIGLK